MWFSYSYEYAKPFIGLVPNFYCKYIYGIVSKWFSTGDSVFVKNQSKIVNLKSVGELTPRLSLVRSINFDCQIQSQHTIAPIAAEISLNITVKHIIWYTLSF